MKKRIYFKAKKWPLIIFMATLMIGTLIQYGCSTEESLTEQKAIPVEYVSPEQVLSELSDPKIKDIIRQNTSQNQILQRDSDEDLEPYFEKIIMEDYTNYSLYLKKYSDAEPFFLFLLITKDNNSIEKAGYLKYIPTNPTEEFNIKTFSGTMQLLDTNFGVAAESHFSEGVLEQIVIVGIEVCKTTIILTEHPCSNGGGHGVGESCQPPFENDAYYSLTIFTNCHTEFEFHHVPGHFVGGGGGANTSNKQRFLNNLSDLQRDYLEDNPEFANKIITFLEHVGYANGTVLAKEIINQTILNPDFKIDIDASYKSPCLIDRSKISGNTPEEIRFRNIYDKLMQSPKFKRLFVNLFGTTSFINAEFSIANIPQPNPSIHTNGLTQFFAYSNGSILNKIIMDRSTLLTESDVIIAKTIIHECIHAFLNVKLKHPSIGMSVDNINDMDLAECINAYYDSFTNPDAEHTFMADFMVPVIVEILTEIKTLLFTPEQVFSVEYPTNGLAILHSPTDTIPREASANVLPWDWNDYFTYLAYTGLESCTSFESIFPPNSVIDYYRRWYILAGKIMFIP